MHEILEEELAFHMIFEHLLFLSIGVLSVKIIENFLKISTIYSRKSKGIINDINDHNLYQSNRSFPNNIRRVVSRLTVSWSNILRTIFKLKNSGFIWLAVSASLLILWHIPFLFDYAQLNENIHELQHLAFILVGVFGYLAIRNFGDSVKILLLILLITMIGPMGIIFSLVDYQIFSVYSIDSHNKAGIYMVLISLILLLVGLPLFIVKKTLRYLKSKT